MPPSNLVFIRQTGKGRAREPTTLRRDARLLLGRMAMERLETDR